MKNQQCRYLILYDMGHLLRGDGNPPPTCASGALLLPYPPTPSVRHHVHILRRSIHKKGPSVFIYKLENFYRDKKIIAIVLIHGCIRISCQKKRIRPNLDPHCLLPKHWNFLSMKIPSYQTVPI